MIARENTPDISVDPRTQFEKVVAQFCGDKYVVTGVTRGRATILCPSIADAKAKSSQLPLSSYIDSTLYINRACAHGGSLPRQSTLRKIVLLANSVWWLAFFVRSVISYIFQ